MLINKIILLAIYKVVQLANILQHYPISATLIKANALAGSKEKYIKVLYLCKQFLLYIIKLEHLNTIQQEVCQYINSILQFTYFQQLTLFLNQKNSKVNYISLGLQRALREWHVHQATTTNAKFLNKEQVYINVSKQVILPQLSSQASKIGLVQQRPSYTANATLNPLLSSRRLQLVLV